MSDSPEQVRAYSEGFRDARAACHAIVLQQIDGDSQCDGTVSRIADDIERLPGPAPIKPGTERMTGLCTDKVSCPIATDLRRALSDGAKLKAFMEGEIVKATEKYEQAVIDRNETDAVLDKLRDILHRTAIALKGPEDELSRHSFHDLPAVAAGRVTYAELQHAALEKAYRELNEIHARDGVPYTHYGVQASVDQAYFTSVVEECRAVLNMDRGGAQRDSPLPGPEVGRADPLPCKVSCDGGPSFGKGVKIGTLLDYLARRVTYNNDECVHETNHEPDLKTALALDCAYRDGARFGWNCGISEDYDKFDLAMASRDVEIRSAGHELRHQSCRNCGQPESAHTQDGRQRCLHPDGTLSDDCCFRPQVCNVPEGWKLVPVEPTDAMLEELYSGGPIGADRLAFTLAYQDMLAASPTCEFVAGKKS